MLNRSLSYMLLAATLAAFCAPVAQAANANPIVVSADAAQKHTVSLSYLRVDSSEPARLFANVLKNDLILSGWFSVSDSPEASVIVSGNVSASSGVLASSVSAKWAGGAKTGVWDQSVSPDSNTVRDAAHAMADTLIEEIAGAKPMASSKILFVGRASGSGKSEIYRCDADGARMVKVTTDNSICLSPNWNPGENSFLYTSWRTGLPAVWEMDFNSMRRRPVSSHPGMNQGAVKSPDGRFVALVLSRSGSVDLYLLDKSRNYAPVSRLTKSAKASEASPTWSPDGKSIAYTSDADGRPRLYVMNIEAKLPSKLVYSSSITESVAPEWGSNGEIAFCGRSGGKYRIYVINPGKDAMTSVLQPLSPDDGADYEDPSWAPDGRHIVCTRTVGYRRTLVVLDTMGDAARTLIPAGASGEWYLPSWSDNDL